MFLKEYVFLILIISLMGCGNSSEPTIRSINATGASAGNEIGSISKKPIKDEPFYQEQWTLHYDKPFYDAHIHIGEYSKKYTGKKVKIAIIDAGLDVNHIEFKKNIISAVNARDLSTNVKSDDISLGYHGTAVTGVIAANINNQGLRGIAPDVEIIFIKLDLGGYLDDEDFLNAFSLAESAGADIISCSWGTGDVSEIVKSKINELANIGRQGKGIVILFASGNDGKEIGNDESAIASVIGVGSTDEENLRAIYSNFGQKIDIVAPGGFELGVATTYPNDKYLKAEGINPFMGTSASTPIVAGLVCLMLEANPNLSRHQVQSIISLGADKIGSIDYLGGKNIYYGHGKVNFSNSLKIVETLNF